MYDSCYGNGSDCSVVRLVYVDESSQPVNLVNRDRSGIEFSDSELFYDH